MPAFEAAADETDLDEVVNAPVARERTTSAESARANRKVGPGVNQPSRSSM